MANVAVVFHSGYGHTLRMAQSVAEGAGAELVGLATQRLHADQIARQGQLHRLAQQPIATIEAYDALDHAPDRA